MKTFLIDLNRQSLALFGEWSILLLKIFLKFRMGKKCSSGLIIKNQKNLVLGKEMQSEQEKKSIGINLATHRKQNSVTNLEICFIQRFVVCNNFARWKKNVF